MSMITSFPSNNLNGFNLQRHHRSRPPTTHQKISTLKHEYWLLANRGAPAGRINRRIRSELHAIMDNNLLPGATPSPSPHFPMWASWVLGSIVAVIIPLWKMKGGFFQKLGNKIDQVTDVVEDVAEAVEDVAEVVENVAEAVGEAASDLADSLPENGKIKNAALWVENASKELREDAQDTIDIMNKVEDLTEEVDRKVEKVIDSIDDKDDKEAAEKVEGKDPTMAEKELAVDKTVPTQKEAQAPKT